MELQFSDKQKSLFVSPFKTDKDIIFSWGSIRSGKTLVTTISFLYHCFAMQDRYKDRELSFAICSHTNSTLERNIIGNLPSWTSDLGFTSKYNPLRGYVDVVDNSNNKRIRIYLFGGSDVTAANRIQGLTLSDIFFDEVVLLKEEFVRQALARQSIPGSKTFMTANPSSPECWIYREFVEGRKHSNVLNYHFKLEDNITLDKSIIDKYKRLYRKGTTFYNRYIEGEWVTADGLIYSCFDKQKHCYEGDLPSGNYYYVAACDGGIMHATTCLIMAIDEDNGNIYCIDEFFYSGEETGVAKSDYELVTMMKPFIQQYDIDRLVIDPAATNLATEIVRQQVVVSYTKANNDVLQGIHRGIQLISQDKVFVNKKCKHLIKDFGLYSWKKDDTSGVDTPDKQNYDPHMGDSFRYGINTILWKLYTQYDEEYYYVEGD